MLLAEVAGTPPFEITWFKDNTVLRSGRKYKTLIQDQLVSLQILKFVAADAGEYQCRATNEVGSSTCSARVTLRGQCQFKGWTDSSVESVLKRKSWFCHKAGIDPEFILLLEPPSFVKKIESTSSLRGGTAAFQATLKGSLPITVTWLKDNDEVTEDDNIRMTFENNVASLYLSGIEVKHDGKYVCQAKNDAGIQRCSALLSVKGWFTKLASGLRKKCRCEPFSRAVHSPHLSLCFPQNLRQSPRRLCPQMSPKETQPLCKLNFQGLRRLQPNGLKMAKN